MEKKTMFRRRIAWVLAFAMILGFGVIPTSKDAAAYETLPYGYYGAGDFDEYHGSVSKVSMGTYNIISSIYDGDWVKYSNINFSQGVSAIEFAYSKGSPVSKTVVMRFRLDSPTGRILASWGKNAQTRTNAATNADMNWKRDVIELKNVSDVTGVHDLYLTFESNAMEGAVGNMSTLLAIQYIHFAPGVGVSPTTSASASPSATPASAVETGNPPKMIKIHSKYSGRKWRAQVTFEVSSNAYGYEIQQSSSSAFSSPKSYMKQKTGRRTFSFSSLSKGSKYYYRVRHVYVQGSQKIYSSWSEIWQHTIGGSDTTSAASGTSNTGQPPEKMSIREIVEKDINNNKFVVRWTNPKTNYKGCQLQVCKDNGFTSNKVDEYVISKYNGFIFRFENTEMGIPWYVRLRGYNEVNGQKVFGEWSNTYSFQPGGEPVG